MRTFFLTITLAGAPHLDAAFGEIVVSHARRFPAMTIVDLYKLTHQAAFGAEHATLDSVEASRWLDREWSALGDGPAEPMYDTIAPGGALVRLNLRAWRDGAGSKERVLRAFLQTGRNAMRDTARFERYWATVVELARKRLIRFDAAELQRHGATMRARGFPAVSHSAEYRSRYRPSYRVVDPAVVRSANE